MKKVAIVFIVIGGVLVTAGAVALGVAAVYGYNQSQKLVTREHVVEENFANFDIQIEAANIEFQTANDGKCKVVCHEKEKYYHTVEVVNNALTIRTKDELKGIDKWFGYSGNMSLIVYLPTDTYENLNITCSTGDIFIDDFNFVNVDVAVSTGDVVIRNADISNSYRVTTSTGDVYLTQTAVANSFTVTTTTGYQAYDSIVCGCDINILASTGKVSFSSFGCNNVNVETSTGDIEFNNFTASGHLQAKASTGDITFWNADANTLKINTTTGDVTGNLLSDKSFQTKTKTGRVNVPSTTGPVCNIETTTGDIIITIGEK